MAISKVKAAEEILTNVQRIRDAKARIDHIQETEINPSRERIARYLPVVGGSWKDPEGYARLTEDSIRTSFDTAGLLALIKSGDPQYQFLKEFLRETTIKGSISVK